MTQPGPGRPRLEPRRRQGRTPRAEILDAAAELFTTKGYASTSTRSIADAVGIRQASLYHHFAAKDDILHALLDETITGALRLAQQLEFAPESAVVRLYALAWYDVRQLCVARWNLGALYLLPELRSERFTAFRVRRDRLREHYERWATTVVTDSARGGADGTQVLPFRLVETAINMRSDESGTAPAYAEQLIPDAVVRMLDSGLDPAPIRAAAHALLHRLDSGWDGTVQT